MKKYRFIYISIVVFFMASVFQAPAAVETAETDQKISFNFVDVEIPAVIKFISEITGDNFIFDEKVKGKVTILTPSKLSVDESFSLFTSVLELKGFTVVPSGTKAYKVIPSTMAKQAGSTFAEESVIINESYITKLLPIKHIKAEEAMNFLKPIASKNGHLSAFGPGNQLLVVDSALNIEKINSILENIDRPPTYQEPSKVHVYPLENADATELSKVLERVIKSSRASKRAKGAVSDGSILTDITLTHDKASNSLIIVASPAEYERIVEVIQSLDKRRRQVYVEALIIEASIDKVKELGTKWRVTARHNEEPVTIGGFGTLSTTEIVDILSGLAGFTLGGMGNFLDVPITTVNSDGSFSTSNLTVPGFAALFDMSDFQDAINILSTPQILTSDNEEAEIHVGENVPFVSKSQRDLSATNTVLSSINREDVGIRLKITPQITEGDYVKLDLYQEISAVKEESEVITTTVGPTTTKRSTKTSVVVKDKQTVVISGLMQEEEEEGLTKTPLLGDIPILGWFFKHTSKIKKKKNLLVFVTPHIVKDSSLLSKITTEKHKEFATKEKQYSKGELLVKFKDGVSNDRALEIISQRGASVIKSNKRRNFYHIKLKNKQEVEHAIKEFTSETDVQYAIPNYKVKIQSIGPEPHNIPLQIE
jgi:general secretion pathway protein D